MTCNDFINVYWKNYILIEKEFTNSLSYISFSLDNYETYSKSYVKLLLELGSEIDNVFKSFCEYYNTSKKFESIANYKSFLNSYMPNFNKQSVVLIDTNSYISPWNYTYDNGRKIVWWVAYNKVKHDRHKVVTINGVKKLSHKFANLENCLNALAFLYQLLLNWYRELAIGQKESLLYPLPGSRLFKLTGDGWENIRFVFDDYFYIDNGNLYDSSSSFPY